MLASMAEREQLRNNLVAKIVYSHETTKSFGTKLRKCADFTHLPVIPSTPSAPLSQITRTRPAGMQASFFDIGETTLLASVHYPNLV